MKDGANWQIVNLKAPVEEFHDAPILYIAGNQELTLNEEQKNKLRTFVEQGGIVVPHVPDTNADGIGAHQLGREYGLRIANNSAGDTATAAVPWCSERICRCVAVAMINSEITPRGTMR